MLNEQLKNRARLIMKFYRKGSFRNQKLEVVEVTRHDVWDLITIYSVCNGQIKYVRDFEDTQFPGTALKLAHEFIDPINKRIDAMNAASLAVEAIHEGFKTLDRFYRHHTEDARNYYTKTLRWLPFESTIPEFYDGSIMWKAYTHEFFDDEVQRIAFFNPTYGSQLEDEIEKNK